REAESQEDDGARRGLLGSIDRAECLQYNRACVPFAVQCELWIIYRSASTRRGHGQRLRRELARGEVEDARGRGAQGDGPVCRGLVELVDVVPRNRALGLARRRPERAAAALVDPRPPRVALRQ